MDANGKSAPAEAVTRTSPLLLVSALRVRLLGRCASVSGLAIFHAETMDATALLLPPPSAERVRQTKRLARLTRLALTCISTRFQSDMLWIFQGPYRGAQPTTCQNWPEASRGSGYAHQREHWLHPRLKVLVACKSPQVPVHNMGNRSSTRMRGPTWTQHRVSGDLFKSLTTSVAWPKAPSNSCAGLLARDPLGRCSGAALAPLARRSRAALKPLARRSGAAQVPFESLSDALRALLGTLIGTRWIGVAARATRQHTPAICRRALAGDRPSLNADQVLGGRRLVA